MWAALGCAWLLAAPVAHWDFEAETTDWRPRAETITVALEPGAGREGSVGLRVRGEIAEGWNYVGIPFAPLPPEPFFQLSLWLKVDELSDASPAPYVKFEVFDEARQLPMKQFQTTVYDRSRLGTWQELTAQVKIPEGLDRWWLALEKGNNLPCAINAVIDDVTLTSITRDELFAAYDLHPLPAPLAAAQGQHPRLFLDAAKVTELRAAIGTTHRDLWEELRALADRYVKSGPPAYRAEPDGSGNEQLWQREVGNAMPHVALAWLLSGDRQYLDSATAWALASCSYPTWGFGTTDGMDLAAGHQLLGLATVYDWCYEALDPDARTTIRETLMRRGGAMFDAAASGASWWARAYLQNHLWVNACGLAAAGLAIFEEHPDGLWWVALAREKFTETADALGPDGASHEGVGYWQYGVEYLLKFNALALELLETDLGDRAWWHETARYALYLTIPRQAWIRGSSLVDLGDSPRGNWYGPDYLLRRLAALYRDPVAQWHAAEVDAANIDVPGARWLNLLWYDPAITPTPPDALPTLRHFDDMEIVSARTDWSGDETLLVAKCGPFIGHEAVQAFRRDPGGGHVHPDANHFVLFGLGEWLIRDDGYQQKATAQHNTLLVDGEGQTGEGKMWFQGGSLLGKPDQPRILRAVSTPDLDTIVGDAAPAYPASLGLQRFVRTWLFVKPDVLLVVDDIATDQPRTLELRYHPEALPEPAGPNLWLAQGKQSLLRLALLTPDGVTTEAGDLPALGRNTPTTMPRVRLTRQSATWRNVMALSWSAPGAAPAEVTLSADGQTATVRGRGVALP